MLRVCHCSEDAAQYDVSAGNFTKQFVAFRFDDRGNRLITLDSAKNGHGAAAATALRVNGESATRYTGFSSEIGTKLRDWAFGQAGGSCYSRAALSSNDSKTLYQVSVL